MKDQMLRDHEVCNHMVSSKCMSWTGIIAGALIAVGLSFIFGLFAAAIGLAAFQTSTEGVTTIAIGGYLGIVIGVIAIMYFSGWVAGHAGRLQCCKPSLGALYGLTAWCLALIITVVLAGQMSQFVTSNLYITTNNVKTTQSFHNFSAPAVTQNSAASQMNKNIERNSVTNQEEAKLLTLSLFLTFALFFIGAIFSALGGYCGAKPCASRCDCDCDCGCGCSSCCKVETTKP